MHGSAGSKAGNYESPSRDRLVFLTTCLIGQHVEVQVKNGSIYTGIFHATNADKDFGIVFTLLTLIVVFSSLMLILACFLCGEIMHLSQFSLSGIILKMARMTKDGTLRGQKSVSDSFSKAPSKTLIIPSKELVQVIAKVLLHLLVMFFLLQRNRVVDLFFSFYGSLLLGTHIFKVPASRETRIMR